MFEKERKEFFDEPSNWGRRYKEGDKSVGRVGLAQSYWHSDGLGEEPSGLLDVSFTSSSSKVGSLVIKEIPDDIEGVGLGDPKRGADWLLCKGKGP